MDELYLDNIDEYVNDHNKIVTYKWLSLTLGVHVNTAKQSLCFPDTKSRISDYKNTANGKTKKLALAVDPEFDSWCMSNDLAYNVSGKMLYHYLDQKRKESSAQLHATYLVSGKFVDNGQTSHKVSVVREEQLEDFKAKMSLVVSVHVYSVQKALLKDSGPLYAVDYDAVKDHLKNCSRYSAIHCDSAVPMSSVELQQAREMQQAPAPEPENKKSGMNGDLGPVSKSSTKPQKGIMGMFANKSTPKNQDNSKETEMKSEQKEDAHVVSATKSKPVTKVNPVANFFGTQTSKKPGKTVKEEEAAQSSSRAEQQHERSQPEEKHETAAAVEPQKDTKKDSRSKTKRIEDSDSEEEKMEKKKRRRIKKPEPDSSDEDVIPDSPQPVETREPSAPSPKKEIEPVKHSHPGSSEMKIRKRRRVLKSQTFLDDDGCMVTEKDYVSESYSESEDDFKVTKQAPRDPVKAKLSSSNKEDEKKNQKKASANANKGTKQASIMGFFQKK